MCVIGKYESVIGELVIFCHITKTFLNETASKGSVSELFISKQ